MSDEKPPDKQIEKVSFGAKLIDPFLAELAKTLPSEKATQHFSRIVITALNRSPKIQQCTKESILGCIFDLASVNLEANNPKGHAYLIPYYNKDLIDLPPDRRFQLQLQVGYRGFEELLYRSNNVRIIKSGVVREGDTFEYEDGLGGNVKPFYRYRKAAGAGRSQRAIIEAFCAIELNNGSITIEIADKDDLLHIRSIALAKGKSPAWEHHEEEMLRKIPIKRAAKHLHLENMEAVAKAIEIDNRSAGLVPSNGNGGLVDSTHNILLSDSEPQTTSEPQ